MKLDLTFEYQPDLVPGVEDPKRVKLHFYLSANLGHALKVVVPGVDAHRVTFELSDSVQIEADDTLTVRAFAASHNEFGERYMVGAGCVVLPLSELCNGEHPVQSEFLDMLVQNAANYQTKTVPCKGRLRILAAQTVFPIAGKSPIQPPHRNSYLSTNREYVVSTLTNYLQRSYVVYDELQPTQENCRGLRLPVWSFGHCQVPGIAFAAPRADPSPQAWWSQAARIGLSRYRAGKDATIEQSVQWFLSNEASELDVRTVIGLMHAAVVSHNSTYASDGVEVKADSFVPISKNKLPVTAATQRLLQTNTTQLDSRIRAFEKLTPVRSVAGSRHQQTHSPQQPQQQALVAHRFLPMEDFSLGPLRATAGNEWLHVAAGDCEDLGAEIALQSIELSTRTDFTDPVLLHMQAVRKHYVVCQALFYVNGAQLSDTTYEMGGHAAAVLVSKDYLIDALEHYNAARPVFQGLERRSGTDIPKEYYSRPVDTYEGTGIMWPIGDDVHAQRMSKENGYFGAGRQEDPLKRIRFMMPLSNTQPNRFYVMLSSLNPLEFADAYSAVEHVALQSTGGRPTIGLPYLDFIQGKKSLALAPAAPMTTDELALTKQLLKFRFPIIAYPQPTASMTESRPNQLLDAVVQHAQGLKRTGQRLTTWSRFPRYGQVDADFVRHCCAEIDKHSRVVKVEYLEENLGPSTGGYELRYYLAN